jgi:hypothetical protein
LFTKPVTKKMNDSRTLSGSNAAQAAAIMTELGAAEAYVYAMGEEPWLGHGIKSDHLYGQREWRW